jgi:hypothetical protein
MSKIKAQPVHFGQSSAQILADIQKSAPISKILDISPKNKLQIPKPRRQQSNFGHLPKKQVSNTQSPSPATLFGIFRCQTPPKISNCSPPISRTLTIQSAISRG